MFGDKIAKIPKLVEKKKFEPLIAMASDKKMDVRLAAIAGLGQVDVDEAYNALGPMLRENEPEVRIAAGKALATLGRPSARVHIEHQIHAEKDAKVAEELKQSLSVLHTKE